MSQQSDGVTPEASSEGGTLPFPENGGTEEQQEYRRRLEQTDLAAYASSDEQLDTSALLSRLQSLSRERDWIFRGQRRGWNLETPVRRLLNVIHRARVSGSQKADPTIVEGFALAEFRRRAHHYVTNAPENDELEWLASHAPLWCADSVPVDCTRSPYVAAFFAVADPPPPDAAEEYGVLWALNSMALEHDAGSLWPEIRGALGDPCSYGVEKVLEKVFSVEGERPVAILPLEPFRANERITVQQRMFLCPSSLEWSFETMLKHVCERRRRTAILRRIRIAPEQRLELLCALERMNITYARRCTQG